MYLEVRLFSLCWIDLLIKMADKSLSQNSFLAA